MLATWTLPLVLGLWASTAATATQRPCENGGIWDGGGCLCSEGLEGPLCQRQKSASLRGTSTTVGSGQTASTLTGEPTVYTTNSDFSKSSLSSGTSYTSDDGSVVSPSSPNLLPSSPEVSGQTTNTITEGTAVSTGSPDSSESTMRSAMTFTKEDGISGPTSSKLGEFSYSPSSPGESFTTSHGEGEKTTSVSPGFTFYTTTPEVSTPTFSTNSSYGTDSTSPPSPSTTNEGSTVTADSEQTPVTLTRAPTIYTTILDLSKSTVSSEVSETTSTERSAAASKHAEASTSPAVSGQPATTFSQNSMGHSTFSDSSHPTDSAPTSHTKGEESPASTSNPGKSFPTSSSDGESATPVSVESLVPTVLSDPSHPTVSPDTTSTADYASPQSPFGPGGLTATPLVAGETTTASTEEPTLHVNVSDLSTPIISSGTSYTSDDAVSSSSPNLLPSTPAVSGWTTKTITGGSTLSTVSLDSTEPTVNSGTTVTQEAEFSAPTSRPGDSFSTTRGEGEKATSFSHGSTFYPSSSDASMTTLATDSHGTDGTSPAPPTRPTEGSTSTLVIRQTATTLTGEPTVYTTDSEFSKSTIASGTSYTGDVGSAVSPSSLGQLYTSLLMSGQTTKTLTEGSTVYRGSPGSSESTVNPEITFTQEAEFSAPTSSPGGSFTTSDGDGEKATSFSQGSTFPPSASEVAVTTLATHSSNTDSASPASPVGPTLGSSTTVGSEQIASTATGEPTVHTTLSDLSESTDSSGASETTGTESSTATSSSAAASSSLAVSGHTATTLTQKSSGHSTFSDSSHPTDSAPTSHTKGEESPASTSNPGKSFPTSSSDGESATPVSVESLVPTILSDPSHPTVSPDTTSTADYASPQSPFGPGGLTATPLVAGETTTASTEETTPHVNVSDLSTPIISSGTSYTSDDAVSSSSPNLLPSTPAVSGWTTKTITGGSTLSTVSLDSTEPTVNSGTTVTQEAEFSAPTSRPGHSFSTTHGEGEKATSFSHGSTFYPGSSDASTTTLATDSHGTDGTSPAPPTRPTEGSTSTVVVRQTATTLTGEPTVYTNDYEFSKSTISSGTSYTSDVGSAVSPSSLGQLYTSSLVSGQTTKTLTEGSTAYRGSPNSSESTVNPEITFTQEAEFSAPTSSPGGSFTISGGDGEKATSFSQGSTFPPSASEVAVTTLATHSSNTDSASPASPVGPSLGSSTTIGSEQTASTATGEPTVHTTLSDLSESTDSFGASETIGTESSTATSSSAAASSSLAVSGHTATTLTQKSSGHSTFSDSSQLTDSALTSHTKGEESSAPTSNPGKSFPTSGSDGESATPVSVESLMPTTLSDPSHPTVSPDTTRIASPPSPFGPGVLTTTPLVSGQTGTAFTEETTLYANVSDLSTVTVSTGSSYTTDDGSALPSSSPNLLPSSPAVSGQTTNTITEGTAVSTGSPDSSESTMRSAMTFTKEDGISGPTSSKLSEFSYSPSSPGESFTTSHGEGEKTTSVSPGFTFYTTTPEVSTPTFSTNSSYGTDSTSPPSPSTTNEGSTVTADSEQTPVTLTRAPTIYTTILDLFKSTVSSEVSETTGTERSAAASKSAEASTSPAVSGQPATTFSQNSMGHSTFSDSSNPTDSAPTSHTKGEESPASTSNPGKSFPTSGGDGESATPITVESPVPPTLSHSWYPTVSPDNTGTADYTSPPSPSGPGALTATPQVSVQTAMALTGETTLYVTFSDLSTPTVSYGTSYTINDGNAVSSSSPNLLPSTPAVSGQTTKTITGGSTLSTVILDSTKPTVNSGITVTQEAEFSAPTSRPGDSFSTTHGEGAKATSFSHGSTFYPSSSDASTTTLATDSHGTDGTSPAPPTRPTEGSTSTVVVRQTATTLTGEPTVYTTDSEFSKSTIASGTSYTGDVGSAVSPSSLGQLYTSLLMSGQTTKTLTEGSTVYRGSPGSSESTVNPEITFTQEAEFSAPTSSPGGSFTTSDGDGEKATSFSQGSTFPPSASEVAVTTLDTHSSNTDSASPASPVGPTLGSSTTVGSEQIASTATGEPTVHTTLSDLSESTDSSGASETTGTESSTATSSSAAASSSLAVSGHTATTLTQKSSGHSTFSDSSHPTDSAPTSHTKGEESPASTSNPGKSFPTSSSDGESATPVSVESLVPTILSDPSHPTVSPDTTSTADYASPQSPFGPGGLTATPLVSGETTTASTEEPTLHVNVSDLSTPIISSGTSYTSDDAVSSSSPNLLPSTPAVSGWTTKTITGGSTLSTVSLDSPEPTVNSGTTVTQEAEFSAPTSRPSDSFSTTHGEGEKATSFSHGSTFYPSSSDASTTTLATDSHGTDGTSPAPPTRPTEGSTSTLVIRQTATTLTGEPTVYNTDSEFSKSTISSGTSYTSDVGSAVSPSSPGQLYTSPLVSGQTTKTLTEGSTVYRGSPGSSESTVNPEITFTQEAEFSAPTSSPGGSFTTSGGDGEKATSFSQGSTFPPSASEVAVTTLATDSSNTDSASPASPVGPTLGSSTTVGSEQTASTLTGEPTVHTTLSDLSESTDSSGASETTGTESSTATSSSAAASSSLAVSGQTATTLTQKSSGHSTFSDSSHPTDSAPTSHTKGEESPASTSNPGKSFPTSSSDGESATPVSVESLVPTILSDPSHPTVSPDTTSTADYASPQSPFGPGGLTATPLVSGETTTASTEETTLHVNVSDLSTPIVSSGTSYTIDDGSAVPSSSPELLPSIPAVSRQSTDTITEGSTVVTVNPDSPEPTVNSGTTVTQEAEFSAPTSRPGDSFSTTHGEGEKATSFSHGYTFYPSSSDASMTTLATDSHGTDGTSPAPTTRPTEGSTSTLVIRQTATTLTGEPTVYNTDSEFSKSTISSGTSYTSDVGSAVSPSSPGQLYTSPLVSGQTTKTLTEGSTVYRGSPGSSESTVNPEITFTQEAEFSTPTSSPGSSATTLGGDGEKATSFSQGSTFSPSASEVAVTTLATDSSNTDSASSASPVNPTEGSSTTVGSEQTASTATGEPTVHTTLSDLSESTDSSGASETTGTESSTATSSSAAASTSLAVSGQTATTLTQKSSGHSTFSDSSHPTDSAPTSHTKGEESPASTSNPGKSFPTSGGDGESATPITVESPMPTILSVPSHPTVSPDTAHTADYASPQSPSGPGGLNATPLVSGQTVTTFTEEPTLYANVSDLSTPSVSSGSSYTIDDGSAVSSSSSKPLPSTPAVSGQTTDTSTEGSTVTPVSLDSSKLTVTSDRALTKEFEFSHPTSGPGDSFTPSGDDWAESTSIPQGSTFYTATSEVSTSTLSSSSSHSTGSVSPVFPSESSEGPSTPVGSEQTALTLTGEPTVHSTISNLSESTVSPEASETTGTENSAATSSSAEASTSPALSGQTATTLTQKPTGHSTFSDSSQPTDSAPTSHTKGEESSAPTWTLSESFPSSGGDGESATPITVESPMSTTLSDPSYPTVSPDTTSTADYASPSSPPGPGTLTPTLVSGQTPMIFTKKTTLFANTSDFSTPTVFPDTYQTSSDLSTTHLPSPDQFSPTPAVSGLTTTISESSNPAVSTEPPYTADNGSLISASTSTPDQSSPTTVTSAQMATSFLVESTVYTTVSDSSPLTGPTVTSSTMLNASPVSTSSSGDSSPTFLVSGQTATIFTGELSVYTTISDLSKSTVSVDTAQTSHSGGPASLPSSGLLPSTTATTTSTEGPSVFTTTSSFSHPTDSPDAPFATKTLSPSPSSSPTHSSSSTAISEQMSTTVGENSSLLITSGDTAKPTTPSPVPLSTLVSSSTSGATSEQQTHPLSEGSTSFQTDPESSNTMPSNSSHSTVSDVPSSASATPGSSSRPVSDSSSAITNSPPLSSKLTRLSTTSTLHPPFTSTLKTMMTPHFPDIQNLCQNGGTWDGRQCVCQQGFFGYYCQSLLDSFPIDFPEKINASLGLIVKVTNWIFTEDLQNTFSQAYRNFTEVFKNEMDKIYRTKDLPQYRGVRIRNLLKGSVVVQHDVLLEANYTPEYKEVFANLTKIIKVKILNETKRLPTGSDKCRNASILCYSEEEPKVSDSATLSFDPQEQCARKAAKEFAQFFYLDELEGKLACVTNCTPGTKTQLDCNKGMCQLQRSGPRCLCPTSDTHWNWGETCELSASKNAVYGGVGAVAVLLALVLLVLAVLLGRSREKLHRQEYNLSREWQGEDVPGSFQNTGIWEDKSLKEDKFGLDSVYSHFQPSLENVDPTIELRCQRPKVVMP